MPTPIIPIIAAGVQAAETVVAMIAAFERLQARKAAALAAGETSIPISDLDEIFAGMDAADADWLAELARIRGRASGGV